MNIRMLNPARRLVGRLFLWFWLTTLLTAGCAVWISKLVEDDIDIAAVPLRHVKTLHQLANRLENQPLPTLQTSLNRVSRRLPFRLVAVAIDSGATVRSDGPPLRPRTEQRLRDLIAQRTPIMLKQRDFSLIGPQPFVFQSQRYALFLAERGAPMDPREWLIGLLGVGVVVSMLLSYWFARSLVKPIQQLRSASKKLADGDWQARAQAPANRQDELGALARDFNSMASQLENLWRGQQRLLGDISHELRSPLTRLQMALGLAHQQNIDAPTLQRIEREAVRMETLINQLLALTRAEAAPPRMETINIDSLLRDLCQDAQFEASNNDKVFACTDLPATAVQANRPLLCSAVENVIRNAIRYARTRVTLTVECQASHWQIIIEDDGPGLPVTEREAIFSPFYRASLARDRDSGGVGLGLAIAKAAVTAHHGIIRAHQAQAGGLQVIIHLPFSS
ncbi:ATP-binding protein [Salinimonas sediminis]|uniref:histidine kinase n=1 Tax=Salinimonas sediminis TaxID=2303538 RepID=A0A346NI61_9ALTE|nr:ATP-binding protein [Salinimonas sediminis]AXR05218.1 HAMP domain-containing protein [Salinimonas sediminis]